MTQTARLILGCGYVGTRVAERWRRSGDRVLAVTRSEDRAQVLATQGLEPVVWDWTGLSLPTSIALPKLDSILIAVSHAVGPHVDAATAHAQGLANLAQWLGPLSQSARWVYLSTTGVFAPTNDGSWVDEDSPVLAQRPSAASALGGETWMKTHVESQRRVVLRPAGIYGPDRVPRWQSIRDQIPMHVDPDSFLNLIHVEDLVSIIAYVSDHRTEHALYCVSDGHSPTRRAYYSAISKWMGFPEPIFESIDEPSSPSLASASRRGSRSDSNKRVNSQRLERDIPVRLTYPSYREGLPALLDAIRS